MFISGTAGEHHEFRDDAQHKTVLTARMPATGNLGIARSTENRGERHTEIIDP
jgi:hypothetical protein